MTRADALRRGLLSIACDVLPDAAAKMRHEFGPATTNRAHSAPPATTRRPSGTRRSATPPIGSAGAQIRRSGIARSPRMTASTSSARPATKPPSRNMIAGPASRSTSRDNHRAPAKGAGAGYDDRDEPRGVEAPPARHQRQPRSRLPQRKRIAARMLTRRHRRRLTAAPGRRFRDQSIMAVYALAKAISNSVTRAALAVVRTDKPRRSTAKKPRRPRAQGKSLANMTAEQRLDFLAACDGKITWARYHAKWGLSL
jgi:hypothetical protein